MINQKLLEALQEKGWSIEVAAARVGVGRVTFSRWVNGHQEPQPALLEMLCKVCEKSADELGYGHLSKVPAHSEKLKETKRDGQVLEPGQAPLATLTEEQFMAFASLLKLGETIMFDPEKRKTLQTVLLVLGSALVKPEGLLQPESWKQTFLPATDVVDLNESALQGFEKLIAACWQFSRGNELALAERLLPECMAKLVPLAQQPSRYQQTVANLAAQGYHLYSIFALHKNDSLAEELYGKQSVQYSLLAGDPNLFITSSKRLGDKYYYKGQYLQALQTFLDALPYTKQASPLFQSKVYTSLAVAYAHVEQRQESLRYLGLALDTFPDSPETDASFSYAEFDLSQMILWEGITRTQLGQTNQAMSVFNRIEEPDIVLPERIRIEIINQLARTAIVSGDLEQGSAYVEAGVTGAKTLGSQRRLNEAYDNFNQIALLWPQEKQVKELRDLFVL